jgi:hypothetical protein
MARGSCVPIIASGIAPIAIYELFSVLIWAVRYWLIRRGHPVAAVTLVYVEVLCSSTVIIYFLGSSTLPHLPVLIGTGVTFLLPKRLRVYSWLYVMLVLSAFLGLHEFSLSHTPSYKLSPLVAAVIGKRKFIYDLLGDSVNTASRMETGSAAGRINVSANTYALICKDFDCEYRGKVSAKGKGEVDMYFVKGAIPAVHAST